MRSARLSESTFREISFGLLLIALSLILTVALAEATFRMLPNLFPLEIQRRVDGASNSIAVSHPHIGHLHKPYEKRTLVSEDFEVTHLTDGYGFRNAWPWPQQADIVAVGDSLTFGYGVEDSQAWPAILNRILSEIDVINLGLIGAGPQQYLRVYETFGRTLRPKLLLVGLFGRNDFWDADLFDRWLRSGADCNYLAWRDYGRPRGLDCKDSLQWRAALAMRKSYVFNLLLSARDALQRRLESESRTFLFDNGRRLELDITDFESKTTGVSPDSPAFQVVLQALQEMHSTAEKDGTKMLVILQPSKEEVYLPLLGEPAHDPSGPLRERLTQSGIDYLDLAPIFRERAAAGKKLFFSVDGHPNAAGYGLIADVVVAYLKQHSEKYDLKSSKATVSSRASRVSDQRRHSIIEWPNDDTVFASLQKQG
jgi:lysophospholipase L1-like esterase